MACITLFAQPMALATTQFARVIRYEDASTWQTESNAERSALRMNWVVVSDSSGQRQLGMCWAAEDC